MTQYLPPNLLALFAPRDPIPYLPPTDKLPHEKTQGTYTGVSQYLNLFEDPKDTPPPTRVETREERIERKRREKAEQVAYKLEQDIALYEQMKAQDHIQASRTVVSNMERNTEITLLMPPVVAMIKDVLNTKRSSGKAPLAN